MSSGEYRRVTSEEITRNEGAELSSNMKDKIFSDVVSTLINDTVDFTFTKLLSEDEILVQNRIERCLFSYMSQRDTVETLFNQYNIERRFTELVWRRLEEENPEFFKAYHLRLMVKQQITDFNRLLSEQADHMGRHGQVGVASMAMSNGSHVSTVHQNSNAASMAMSNGSHVQVGVASIAMSNGSHVSTIHQNSNVASMAMSNGSHVQVGVASMAMSNGSHVSTMHQNPNGRILRPENMLLPLSAAAPNVLSPSGPSMHASLQTALDMSSHSRNLDVTGNMFLARSSNRGTVQALGGGMIESEPGYAGSLPFQFGAHNSLMEHRAVLGDASVSSFSSVESDSQPLNETLLDPDPSSFGYIGSIPQTFGYQDLEPHFSNGTDILDSYPRSSFMAPNTSHFLDPRENQGDVTTTESLRRQDLGGD